MALVRLDATENQCRWLFPGQEVCFFPGNVDLDQPDAGRMPVGTPISGWWWKKCGRSKLNSRTLRERGNRSQSEPEMMRRVGIRFVTLLLNPHWTDSSTVTVFVAVILILWWLVQQSGCLYISLRCCKCYFLQSLCYQSQLLKESLNSMLETKQSAVRFGSNCSGLSLCHCNWYISATHWMAGSTGTLPLHLIPIWLLSCGCFPELGCQQRLWSIK